MTIKLIIGSARPQRKAMPKQENYLVSIPIMISHNKTNLRHNPNRSRLHQLMHQGVNRLKWLWRGIPDFAVLAKIILLAGVYASREHARNQNTEITPIVIHLSNRKGNNDAEKLYSSSFFYLAYNNYMATDVRLLDDYCNEFFGYGNLNSNFWFIGIEEGGGNNFAQVQRRLSIWDSRGHPTTMCAATFHKELELTKDYFNEGSPLQFTWNKLIHLYMKANGERAEPDRERRRKFQIKELGRLKANHCLLELLPLPAPSSSKWPYDEWFPRISWLANRNRYRQRYLLRREEAIQCLIRIHRPKVVVMYGLGNTESWERISRSSLGCADDRKIREGRHHGVTYISIPHPRNVSLSILGDVGKSIEPIINT